MSFKIDKEKIKKFEEENFELFQNNLIISFLKNPVNKDVYWQAISNPTPENKYKLDCLFKNFYFNIRFISHISTTLKYNSINYDKRLRLLQNRFLTTLDAPINSEEGEESFVDLLIDLESSAYSTNLSFSDDISEQVVNPKLYEALNSLTDKQREIINLAYVKGYSDTEIALLLDKSQQAVSKTHKKALNKLLNLLSVEKEKQNKDRKEIYNC